MKQMCLLLLAVIVAWVESTPGHFEYGFRPRRVFTGAGFCLKRHDGPYAVGCVPQFVSCSSKTSFVMFCRDGLFFDDHTGKCVPKWDASSCRGHGYHRPHHGLIPPYVPVQPERSRFCMHRADGDYNIGCTPCYITCSGNRAFAMECPAGLVLDEASGSCVEKSYVAVCDGVPTTTSTTTTTTTTTTPPPASEATTEPTTYLPPVKPCHHHHYGFFGMGCSPKYFVCVDGRPSYHTCRHGLAFDEDRRICVPKCEIRKCGCRPRRTTTTTTTTTTTEPASEATTETPASEATTEMTTTRSPVKPCRHHYGFFGMGCSSRYLVCIDGLPTYHTCRRGLTFDERRMACLPRHLVKPCVIPVYGEEPVDVGEAY